LGRQRIYSIPNQNEKIEDNTLALECFRVWDHFDLGSLPRNLFVVVLRELWHKIGQSLLPDEVVSISNAFECRDGRDGHIDYVKYVKFASSQGRPCLRHSMIVCPYPQ